MVKALHYLLKNSEIFQKENIHVDNLWLQKITTSAESETCDEENDFCDVLQIEKMQDAVSQQERKQDDDHNNVDDIDINHCNAPSVNTLLDEQQIDVNSMFLTYVPDEGKRPTFNEPLAEYLCFPSIFCGQKRPPNEERTHPTEAVGYFLNMNCILLTLMLHHLFQIYFGKQNISKLSRLQIKCP